MYRSMILCGLLLATTSSFAQDRARVVKMTVSPAPASASTMPYPLLPHLPGEPLWRLSGTLPGLPGSVLFLLFAALGAFRQGMLSRVLANL